MIYSITAVAIFFFALYKLSIDLRKPKLKSINELDYSERFNCKACHNVTDCVLDDKKCKRKNALNFAIDTRKFEIEMYWKRAGYFWVFIALAFTGLFRTNPDIAYGKMASCQNEIVLAIISIGFLLSLAFVLVNKASKVWQNNWESHIYLLQDEIMGPIYSTVMHEKTYSISKVNEVVSRVILSIWVLFYFMYFNSLYESRNFFFFDFNSSSVGLTYLIMSATFYFACSMSFFYGRTMVDAGDVKIYQTKLKVQDP